MPETNEKSSKSGIETQNKPETPKDEKESANESKTLANLPKDGFGFLSGCFEHTLDEKGRVSLPSAFRMNIFQQKVSEVIVTNSICDGVRCLEGFSLREWQNLLSKLSSNSRFSPTLRRLENFYLARASNCAIDNSGRINLPSYLREFGGLQKEVVFTSSLFGFRIWDKANWEKLFGNIESALFEDEEHFKDLGI